jgi:antitoxin VapB
MLNIKDPRTHQLAKELAKRTGESMTQAVTKAIEERLGRTESQEARVDRLMAIGRRCAGNLEEPNKSIDHGDFLYDEQGLPK